MLAGTLEASPRQSLAALVNIAVHRTGDQSLLGLSEPVKGVDPLPVFLRQWQQPLPKIWTTGARAHKRLRSPPIFNLGVVTRQ